MNKKCHNSKFILVALLLNVVLLMSHLSAGSYVWDGSQGTSTWTDAANWTPGTGPPSGAADNVTFDATTSQNCNIPAGTTIGEIRITSTYAGTVSLDGAVVIDNSGVSNGSFTMDSSGSATFNGGGNNLTVLGSYSLSDSTHIAGNGLLIVSGDFSHTAGTFTANSGAVMFGGNATPSNRSLTLSAPTQFNDVYINDGLVLYYKFDETAGSTASDSSGHGQHGTWQDNTAANVSVPTAIDFNNSRSIEFDGTGDYVNVGTVNTDFTKGLTISVWVYYHAFQNWSRMCDFGQGSANDNFLLANRGTTNELQYETWTGGSSNGSLRANALSLNQWMHVVAAHDATGFATLYVDGIVVDTGTFALPVLLSRNNCYIAQSNWGSDSEFDGVMDDFRLYNRGLSAPEVIALYKGKQPATSSSITTLNNTLDVNGDFVLAAGTLAPGSHTIQAAQDWWNYGGLFTQGTSIVTFDGTTNTYNLQTGGQKFNHVNINDSGTTAYTMRLTDTLYVNGNLGILDGDLDVNVTGNHTIDLDGNWGVGASGVFIERSGNVIVSGDSTITSNGAAFNNLTINDEALTLTDGLLLYYKFDETAGSTASDSSGNSHDGTWQNDTVASTSVPTTKFTNVRSIEFDGTTDYVSNSESGFLPVGNELYAISLWFRADNSGDRSLIGWGQYNSNYRVTAMRLMSTNQIRHYWWADDLDVTVPGTTADGNWHHVVAMYDGTTRSVYYDGVLAGSDTPTNTHNVTTTNNLNIGQANAGDLEFDGSMDEVRIYNRPLTLAEIAFLANGHFVSSVSTATLIDTVDVNGDLELTSGTLVDNGQTINLAGNWSNTGGAFTNTGVVTLDGTSLQNITANNVSFGRMTMQGTQAYFSANVTFDTSLIVHSGVVTAGPVNLYFGNGADFRIGGGSSTRAVVSFDTTVVTNDSVSNLFTLSVQAGGDIHAKKQTRFNFLDNGIVFHTGSQMGSNTSVSNGTSNFQFVTFDNIANGEYGLNFSNLTTGDDDQFPEDLYEIVFNEISIATTARNARASATTPYYFNFHSATSNFGNVSVNGISGETDPNDVLWWDQTPIPPSPPSVAATAAGVVPSQFKGTESKLDAIDNCLVQKGHSPVLSLLALLGFLLMFPFLNKKSKVSS